MLKRVGVSELIEQNYWLLDGVRSYEDQQARVSRRLAARCCVISGYQEAVSALFEDQASHGKHVISCYTRVSNYVLTSKNVLVKENLVRDAAITECVAVVSPNGKQERFR